MKNTLTKLLLLAGVILSSSTFAQKINVPGGAPNFKPSVASPLSLPPTGNAPGDARVSISNASIYIWDGSAWQGTAGGGAAMWGSIGGTLSSQTDLQTALNGKEPTVTATTSADYYRGDKTFQNFNSAARSAVVTQTITNGVTTTSPSEDAVYDGLATKEPTVTATTSADYYRGDKTFQPFASAAQSAVVTQTITNGVTITSPSEDAVYDALALKQSTSEKNQNNGYAGLDAGGKIDVNQLPNTVMLFKGQWDASTNTPTLSNGTGSAGFVYRANVAGTVNFGAGPISFQVGDWAVYNGTIWEYAANSNLVVSVNGQQGVVSLSTTDIPEGTNLYYTDARAIAAPLTGFTSGAGTVTAADSVLSAIQKVDGNITSATTKSANTPASFDGSGVLQSLPNWSINSFGNYNLSDSTNSVGGYSVMSAFKNGDVTGGTAQGYNFYVNGTIDGYYGFNSNLQGVSNGQVEHITLNSSQATTGNYFMINGNMTGNITTGGFFGLNATMSGTSDNFTLVNGNNTGNTNYVNGLSLFNSGNMVNDFNGVNVNNSGSANGINITTGVNTGSGTYLNGFALTNSGNITNGITGFNMSNSGNANYISGININNSGTSSGGNQLVNVGDSSSSSSTTLVNAFANGTYSGNVTGLSVDVSGATSSNKVGISNNGVLNSNSSLDTSTTTLTPAFALNYLGGQFKISSGFPTVNEFGFGNNLATVSVFDDDMPPDLTTLGLGYTHVGFVGSVAVASGKTVDAMNMALGGAGVPSGSGGTITNANMFRAEGFFNQGGSLTATNMHGFIAGTQLCGMATNCWGYFDNTGGAENYMGQLAIGTVSKKNTATYKFDVLGDSKLDGDLDVTGAASLGNGSTATTQSANDNSTKVATTAYVDSAVAGVTTSSGYVLSNISSNTTLNAATASAYFVDTTGGAVTVTLPAAASNSGKFFLVKHIAFGGANDITVARTGGDTIEGGTSDTLTSGMARKYVSNGTAWFIEE